MGVSLSAIVIDQRSIILIVFDFAISLILSNIYFNEPDDVPVPHPIELLMSFPVPNGIIANGGLTEPSLEKRSDNKFMTQLIVPSPPQAIHRSFGLEITSY